ncbi:hypothetical protein QFC19_006656 [Naganishia cerealis]|uniref:Uncharacterized protein n=1 Tax=Naganishia cerealis TaxID=610337 RepID=A0ACC2VFN6_9TREE|nr:hypothetical protein QFC19_006656 [Naganishia cerealis]
MIGAPLAVLLACLPYLTQATNSDSRSQIYEFPLKSTNVLATVPPPSVFNFSSIFLPESVTLSAAKSTPFHVYHPDFHAIIGPNPHLTLVWSNDGYAAAHEAPIYHQASNALFFAANAGGPLGFSGANASNVVWRMDIAEAAALTANASLNAHGDWVGGNVTLQAVPNTNNQLENVNGGANYRGQLVFMTEGREASIPSGITVVNPEKPFNATVILNNFFGRQFNSLNDVAYHRPSGDLFFTDVTYGFTQDFRPTPGLPNQIYRFNETSGLVSIVADGFSMPNGICFSPDQRIAYVADTGLLMKNRDPTRPAAIYAFDVSEQGVFSNRRTFAFVNSVVPDGVHVDAEGNVWIGDGVVVYNPQGVLLGKIFLGSGSANFIWGGDGKMFILAETKVYLAEIAAKGDLKAKTNTMPSDWGWEAVRGPGTRLFGNRPGDRAAAGDDDLSGEHAANLVVAPPSIHKPGATPLLTPTSSSRCAGIHPHHSPSSSTTDMPTKRSSTADTYIGQPYTVDQPDFQSQPQIRNNASTSAIAGMDVQNGQALRHAPSNSSLIDAYRQQPYSPVDYGRPVNPHAHPHTQPYPATMSHSYQYRSESPYSGMQPPVTTSGGPFNQSAMPLRRPVSDPNELSLSSLRMSDTHPQHLEDDQVGPLPTDASLGLGGPVGRSRSTTSGRSLNTRTGGGVGGDASGAGPYLPQAADQSGHASASVYSLDSGLGAYGQYPAGTGMAPGISADQQLVYQHRRTSGQSMQSNGPGYAAGEGPAYDAQVSRDHGFPHPPPPIPLQQPPSRAEYNPYFAAANDYFGPSTGMPIGAPANMSSAASIASAPGGGGGPSSSSGNLLRTASSASSLVSLKRTNTTNIGSKNAKRSGRSGAIDVNKPPYTKEFVDDYRARMKGDPDPEAQFAFAKYLIEAARIIGDDMAKHGDSRGGKKYRDNLLAESLKHIKRLATSGSEPYAEAQFFLANMYGTGQLGLTVDYEKAYQLYMQASKQNHPAATYRTAVCNELGAGTRKEANRAVLFYRKAASLRDTAAMYKLGMVLLNGLLEQPRNQREGITWLRRAAQQADEENPHALHELAMLHENPNLLGRGAALVPKDPIMSRDLYIQAAQLGYPPSQFKLGTCYEYGTLGCPVDPKRSIAWLSRAAEKGDPEAELALSGWFLTGAEGVLKQNDGEAYLWARKSANKGLAKAEFAVGYYTEVGIGVKQDLELAKRWYMRAAGPSSCPCH